MLFSPEPKKEKDISKKIDLKSKRGIRMGKSRKGSINLPLAAIVTVVLVITLLLLGLVFIRGTFKKSKERVDEAVSIGEISNPPTANNPITVTPSSIKLKEGEVSYVRIAFMNANSNRGGHVLEILPSGVESEERLCNPIGENCIANPHYNDGVFIMEKNQIDVWTVALSPSYPEGRTEPINLIYTAQICTQDPNLAGDCSEPYYKRDFTVLLKP